jgi:hypothetical protein
LLCVLLGPGPALPALHFALVAHRVCPEHGELEHVEPDALERSTTVSAARSAAATGDALVAGSAGTDGHGHEACGVGAAGNSVAVLPAARATVAAPCKAAHAAPSGTERAHQRIALLRYAPRLPPPARS